MKEILYLRISKTSILAMLFGIIPYVYLKIAKSVSEIFLIFSFVSTVLAICLGVKALKNKDKSGLFGLLLGSFIVLMIIVIFIATIFFKANQ